MNAKVIGIGVGVVVIAIIAFMMVSGKASAPEVPTADTAQQETAGQPTSLKDLLALGTNQTCTFTDGPNTGVVYVSGGKVRGDFASQENGQTIQGHTISDGVTVYTWMDSMNAGFKMNMATATPNAGPQQGMDVNKKMEYHCSVWTVDASKFELPKDVTFNDMNAMMKGMVPPAGGAGRGAPMPEGMPSMQGNATQCAACDSLPPAQKSACRAALQCK